MITSSGVHIQKKGGVEGIPTSMDIAIHAGRICRFGGALWMPLLPHLVFVGLMAYRRVDGREFNAVVTMLWGFLHDAHECVTGEVPRPFKCDCMRDEQGHLDQKLLPIYCGDHKIDFDLIKRCDIDACDVEATYFELRGYKTVTLEHGVHSYGKYKEGGIHANHEDIELFEEIVRSPFYRDTIYGPESVGVRLFYRVLECARKSDAVGLHREIQSWGLL